MTARRLLGLEPEAQQALFDFYQATLEAVMDRARREGSLGARRPALLRAGACRRALLPLYARLG